MRTHVSGESAGSELDESCHELFKPRALIGFDRIDFDPEFLTARPAHNGPIDKNRGMVIRQEDTERDHHPRLNGMRPINPPSVQGEIPGHPAALKFITGIIHRTLDWKSTKGPHLEPGPERDRAARGS